MFSLFIAPQDLNCGCCVPRLLFGKLLVKLHCSADLIAVGMALGDAADQLEGAEGVKAEAFISTKDLGLLAGNGGLNGLEVAFLLGTVGMEEENFLSAGIFSAILSTLL